MAKKTSSKEKGSGKTIPKVKVVLEINPKDSKAQILTLKNRFENNPNRHNGMEWVKIHKCLEAKPNKVSSLFAMESTGGEPDVVDYDKETGEYIFIDCSKESPNRRSICYDREGEMEREKKGLFPGGCATELAKAMGIKLLNEKEYRNLQKLGEFDLKTSSWIATPPEIRKLGGALFCDRRYDTVFLFHNGASSFYGSRGFRGVLRV